MATLVQRFEDQDPAFFVILADSGTVHQGLAYSKDARAAHLQNDQTIPEAPKQGTKILKKIPLSLCAQM